MPPIWKIAPLIIFFYVVECLKIDVLDGNVTKRSFTDGNAYFQDRSYMIPKSRSEGIRGSLVYPDPKNACTPVEDAGNNSIAFLAEYMDCPSSSMENLRHAHYIAVVAFTRNLSYSRQQGVLLPQAVIIKVETFSYLNKTLLSNDSYADWEVLIWDDTYSNLEKLFIIFVSTLMGAVVLAILVFCTILVCRLAILKFRTRALGHLQVRALPKRKYHRVKEKTESCSICLEEFKEGDTMRVLPCQHVFHVKCVDEWLQKWNRTCPLCKSTIKKKKGLKARNPPPTTEDETTHLIPSTEPAVSSGGGAYGATGYAGGDSRCHRRNASGTNTFTSTSSLGRTGKRQAVVQAEVETWGSEVTDEGCGMTSPSFHTPIQSDDNFTRSSNTAQDSENLSGPHVVV